MISISRLTTRQLQERAIDLARQSKAESDDRVHPRVGAVIVRSDNIIAEAYRGQHTPGNHAEQEAIKSLRDEDLAGSTVYTTLEPCVIRGHQMPCSQRLIDSRVREVFIGILDPNPDIRGQGEWKLEERGIIVRKFEPDFVEKIREMNQEFINYMLGLGIIIQSPSRDQVITDDVISIEGIYRVRPTQGDRIRMFARHNNNYYPQGPIDFGYNKDQNRWRKARLKLDAGPEPRTYEIIIARYSEDLAIAHRHYELVHKATRQWIGLEMDVEPPGFERLASVTIVRAPILTTK